MKKAYVLINCDMGQEELILNTLRGMKSVKEAHGTFGAYDIIAEVIADTIEELREEITWKIRKVSPIRSTLTLTGVERQG
ncbi:MAG: AsnC family transcriptional regulator [Nitrosopumilales archaeon CG_4_9_14_0_2_um_filter_34_16]|nr:MAG: AsnC family transcriptional regulator [Nitrosopumilales archaeon CG_4_9_14_0_2_um_filter_34_16]